MIRRRLFVALVASLAIFSAVRGARAQGLADPTTGAIVPVPQAAAADDAFALFVNPAGLAYVEAFQAVAGYAGRFGQIPEDSLFLNLAASPTSGLALGAEGGFVVLPTGFGTSYSHLSGTAALRFDRSFALGGTLRGVTPSTPGAPTDIVTDLGAQWRPWSWLAFGGALQDIGVDQPRFTSLRAGVSTRPLGEWLTLGLDARAVAGSNDLLSPAAYTRARFEPAANAVVRLGGLLFTGGAVWRNPGQPGPVDVQIGLGVQVDTHHLGAAVTGGYATREQYETTVLARASVERYPTVFPFGGGWIALTLTGEAVPEEDDGDIISELLAPPPNPIAVLAALERAVRDPEVKGLVLRVRGLSLGWGRLTELRSALVQLREAGKKVIVYFDSGDDADIYLASAADRVYLSPAGSLDMNGLQLILTYFGATLDMFGVEAEAVTAGAFKSAPRTFTASEPSANELLVRNELLDTMYEILVESIAQGRSLDAAKVEELIDLGGLSAEGALDAGLVDGLAYWDEIPERVEELEGFRPFLDEGYLDQTRREQRWDSPPRIAIVPVLGMIQQGGSGGGLFGILEGGAGADDIIDALDAARRDPGVAAVVLRIDSPGGDALASDLIWHAVMRLRDEKPVVASMGDVAASGGYYVASAANVIYAEPNTFTGSIGVYALFFNGEQLLRDLGVRAYELNRGARPGPSVFRGLSEGELERFQKLVDESYERFLAAILLGRTIDETLLREVAEGRVWTGADAKERNLVDELGGLTEALAKARSLAGIPSPEESEIAILTGQTELFPRLRTAVSALAGQHATREEVRAALRLLLGSPDSLALLGLEGRPLALPRARIRVE